MDLLDPVFVVDLCVWARVGGGEIGERGGAERGEGGIERGVRWGKELEEGDQEGARGRECVEEWIGG